MKVKLSSYLPLLLKSLDVPPAAMYIGLVSSGWLSEENRYAEGRDYLPDWDASERIAA